MAREEHHVVPDPDEGWNVKKGGDPTVIIHTETKEEAIQKGREISIREKTEFIIHGKDGKIQESDSHGHDPESTPG